MKDKLYCHGCGYQLQTNNQEELGYIPKINETKEIHYCKRCYEMIFRNQAPKTFLPDKDYWDLFSNIAQENKLYVLIIDIFNIEGSILDQMIHKLKDKQVLIVLNKRDLIPKLVKDNKIYQSIKNHYKLKNLTIIDYVVVSAKKKYNIDLLLDKINYYRQDDVFLIGVANVGKSSIVNSLINSITQGNQEYISTSYHAGTTLGLIKVPFDKTANLIDTPGIINKSDVNNGLNKETLEIIIPKGEIRPKTYQLNEKQTLFISSLLQLDYIAGEKQGFTIYAANQIQIHRTKLENSLTFRENNLGKNIITFPTIQEIEELKFKQEKVTLIGKNVDLVISGLCWINFKNIEKELELNLTIPQDVEIYIRKGLI